MRDYKPKTKFRVDKISTVEYNYETIMLLKMKIALHLA